MMAVPLQDFSWDRMIRAVEKVRERLSRATAALEQANIPYGVADGHAVASWVSRVDEAAVRNTQDVDLLIRRSDLESTARALEAAGFVRRQAAGMIMFLDGPDASARDSVHILFAGEKVRAEYAHAAAEITDVEHARGFRVVALDALVRMKLTSYRDKDRTHVRDLMDVGLVDDSWLDRLPADLSARLKQLIDTPEG
jgi:hypothetical protein